MYTLETAIPGTDDIYTHGDLETAILDALVEAGKDPDALHPDDLAPIDEFHARGRKATVDLSRDIGFEREMQVLDVGCGIGGASRYITREFGCNVTGLDLSAEYCRVAANLTRRLGLEPRLTFLQGNALDMPFPEASFDVIWTQHASMNISDKTTFYSEMWRVLKPGGRLAMYDVLAGSGGEPYFPVPWAREPSASFLITDNQLLDTIKDSGFEIVIWRNVTEAGRSWFRQAQDKIRKNGLPHLGLHLLLGSEFRRMVHNQFLNLEENRVALLEAVVRRPADKN